MNRLLWTCFLFFAFLISKSFAQDKLFIAINGGFTYSSFSSKNDFKPFYFGTIRPDMNVDISYDITKKLFLHSGLGYYHTSQKRIHLTNEFIGLKLPLSIGVKLKKMMNLLPFIHLFWQEESWFT